jgi:hypothetical protein
MNRLRADQILGFWSRARKQVRNGVRADYHHTTSEVDLSLSSLVAWVVEVVIGSRSDAIGYISSRASEVNVSF